MWAQYRKAFIPTQILIGVICGVAVWSGRWTSQTVFTIFFAMEIGAVLGAWWGTRMKQKIEAADRKLPLEDRR